MPDSKNDVIELYYQASGVADRAWVEAILASGVVGVASDLSDCADGAAGECSAGMCSGTGESCGHTEADRLLRPRCMGDEGCETISGVRFRPLSTRAEP